MTEEELKLEAEKFARTEMSHPNEYGMYYCTFLKVAEPREKRIVELEMTVGTLRTFSNEQATCIEKFEEQIEKMKCCSMCKYYSMSFLPYWCTKNNTAPHCSSKCDKWEIKENG